MARPNPKITARMRARGFVPIGVAAKTCGQPRTTLRGWLAAGRIKGARVGAFVFVQLASLAAALEPTEL